MAYISLHEEMTSKTNIVLNAKESLMFKCQRPVLRWLAAILLLLAVFTFSAQAAEVDVEDVQTRAQEGVAEAQVTLGMLYANGYKVEQDFSKARSWWDKAAAQGNSDALYYTGLTYAKGSGVEKNMLRAKEWWEKAAEKNNIQALFNLAMLYVYGTDVKGSYVEAGRYFEQAARRGHTQSQFNLGVLFERGMGRMKSVETGYAWVRIAADAGNPTALEYIKGMVGKMNADQIKVAKVEMAEIKKQLSQK